MLVAPSLGELREILAGLPDDNARALRAAERVADWRVVLATAYKHGVGSFVRRWLRTSKMRTTAGDALAETEPLERTGMLTRDVTREALRRVLGALERSGVAAVSLKGPLLASRLYDEDVVRPSTDLDVLVEGSAVESAARALEPLGYMLGLNESEKFFLENHHHVHAFHRTLPTVEVHFHAYRGFGTVLPAGPLVGRSGSCGVAGWDGARILSPEDEFLYLAVHGASHRFERLGWLFDLKLFLAQHPELRWDVLWHRGMHYGLASVLGFTCELLRDWLGKDTPARPHKSFFRSVCYRGAQEMLFVRGDRRLDAARHFAFSTLLCDDRARLAVHLGRFARITTRYSVPAWARAHLAC